MLSSPRQQSFVPDGGPAKLTFGLSAPQNVTASFLTAAWILYSNRAPIFIAVCDRKVMKNYFAATHALTEIADQVQVQLLFPGDCPDDGPVIRRDRHPKDDSAKAFGFW